MKLTTQTPWHKRLARVIYTSMALSILKGSGYIGGCYKLLFCFVRNNGQHGSLMVSVLVSANKTSFSQISLSRFSKDKQCFDLCQDKCNPFSFDVKWQVQREKFMKKGASAFFRPVLFLLNTLLLLSK